MSVKGHFKLNPFRKIICHKCFFKFAPHKVYFRCTNPSDDPNKTPIRGCPTEEDRFLEPPQNLKHAFACPGANPFYIPLRASCDKCGHVSNQRLCPNCHAPLLYNAGITPDHIIAILGGSESGKSHYFTVLIHLLENQLGYHFNAHLSKADDETTRLFRTEYYERLFVQKTELNLTPETEKYRLLFRLNFGRKNTFGHQKNRPLTLAFYDIAGEHLNTSASITTETQYIRHAAGIIFLLDPLQLPTLRDLMKGSVDLPTLKMNPADILNNIVGEFRKEGGVGEKATIKTPIAICLSKMDQLRPLFPNDNVIFTPHQHKGAFDFSDFERVDGEVRLKLKEWLVTNLIQVAEHNFKTKAFFALSALGQSPDPDTKKLGIIQPMRVEDPFLWILKNLGYIKATKH